MGAVSTRCACAGFTLAHSMNLRRRLEAWTKIDAAATQPLFGAFPIYPYPLRIVSTNDPFFGASYRRWSRPRTCVGSPHETESADLGRPHPPTPIDGTSLLPLHTSSHAVRPSGTPQNSGIVGRPVASVGGDSWPKIGLFSAPNGLLDIYGHLWVVIYTQK